MEKSRNLKWLMLVMFLWVISFSIITPSAYAGSKISDISGHWAEGTIQSWVDNGLIKGYPDGTFKPENNITRAEFITLVNGAFGYTKTAPISFTDVDQNAWYASAISVAVEAGYISGYPDGTMRPDNPISREEAATIIMKINKLEANPSAANTFTDAASLTWSKGAVGAVFAAGIMVGYPDGSFGPQKLIKRGEATVALDRAMKYIAGPVTPLAPSVTRNDDTNTVSGMTTAMEYKLDSADYATYVASAFNALDFSGNHTLMVRFAASGINPFGPATTLTFTTNAITGGGGGGGGSHDIAVSAINIAGTAQVGSVLTATGLLPEGATASYKWQIRDTVGDTYADIAGAIAKTYTPVPGDVNKFIKVVATGIGSYYGTVASAATGAVATVDNSALTVATVNLGTAGNYAILAKTGISTVPASVITGNIGVSPAAASYITGFSLTMDTTNVFSNSSQVIGKAYAADYTPPTPANLTTAISDMETAYTNAAGRAANYTELYTGDISSKTLTPGVYKWGTGVLISKDVTLYGGANDVWIFQIDEGITQANGASIILTGGAQAKNIFWQAAETVAIGTGAHFEGIILGKTNISLGANASINGRLLAQTAVTLIANTVVDPAAEAAAIAAINAGSATLQNYTVAGITGVTTGHLDVVNIAIVAAKVAKGSDLTKSNIQAVVDKGAAIAAINAGTAILQTYTDAEITGVTTGNLDDVNIAVAAAKVAKGSDLTKSNIQAVVDKGAAIKTINAGTAILQTYTDAEITGVTTGNLDDVNTAVAAAKVTKGSALTKSEIQTVVIAAGATTELAKITDVSVTHVPSGTANTKAGVEAAMLTIANAAVADGYTVTIAAGSTYDVDTMAWVGKFVVTDDTTAANTKTDGANRTITVV